MSACTFMSNDWRELSEAASKEQLTKLPGVDDVTAERMIAGRPYKTKHELVTRHVVSEEEYQSIKGHVTLQ